MTASLPPQARECFARFITTEYTTVDARQQPITWPVTPVLRRRRADDRRHHRPRLPEEGRRCAPQPARLPAVQRPDRLRASAEPAQVLVQGTAEVDDADLDANRERYMRESAVKLPATKKMHPPKFMRGPLNWYYARIYVRVRPERVFVWPDGDPQSPPEIHDSHLEEVRSGHSEEPAEPHAPAAGGEIAWDSRIAELGSRHPMAVLSWVGPDGFPLSVRLPVAVDRGGEADPDRCAARRACRWPRAAPASPPTPTPRTSPGRRTSRSAATSSRSHDGEWALVPHRLVGGFELPKGPARLRSFASRHWRFYKTAKARARNR